MAGWLARRLWRLWMWHENGRYLYEIAPVYDLQKSLNDRSLSLRYIRGLKSLGTLGNVEFDLITFSQGFETFGLDCGKMHEYIVAAFLLDKAKALCVVEPLHSAFCQLSSPPFHCKCCACNGLQNPTNLKKNGENRKI